MEMTEDQIAKLTEGLNEGITAVNHAREGMAVANEKVDTLLKRQTMLEEGLKTAAKSNELKEISDKLDTQADRMMGLANAHTDLLHSTKVQMSVIAESHLGKDQGPFSYRGPNSKGAVFQCRQQALELGMYLMATMARRGDIRNGARLWLADHKQDLRWLPQIPESFVTEFGREWHETMVKVGKQIADYGGSVYMRQDLVGGATPGSILVRPEFSNTLIRNVERHGKFRSAALIWPMGSDTVRIPRRRSGVSVFWEGEAVAGTETDPDFELLSMTAKKMLMLHQFSSELSEDAAISLADILMFEFSLAIALEEDRIGFNGDGAGGNTPGFAGFIGVLGAAANATEATADLSGVPQLVIAETGDDTTPEITELKLRECTGRLHTWARSGAAWYMHRTVHADLDAIQQGTAGGAVIRYTEAGSAMMMGYPIVDVEQTPVSPSSASTNVISLGDLRTAWYLGDRRTMELMTSEHFAFNTDQLTVRVTSRIGFLMAQGNGMVVLRLAA